MREILDKLAISGVSTKEVFKSYHYLFKKEYSLNSQEGIHRYRAFKENIKFINQRNSEGKSWKLGYGPFTDISFAEYQKKFGLNNKMHHEMPEFNPALEKPVNTANDTNSDLSAFIGPVRNQNDNTNSSCQTCWAFQTAAVLGGLYNMREQNLSGTNPNVTFSAQQFMDCLGSPLPCDMINNTIADISNWVTLSFWGSNVWRWTFLEQSWPWQKGVNNTCHPPNTGGVARYSTKMTCGPMTQCNVASAINQYLPTGPALVIVDQNSTDFQHYAGGVFAPTTCEGCPCHKVTLYGYDAVNTAYRIRNDFGPAWGEGGNMRIIRNDKLFSCGVTRQMWFPVLGP